MEGILLGLNADFAIEQVIQEPHHCIIVARSVVVLSCCPLCSSPSERAHSQYQRTVADLPCGGCTVTLKLIVRRFFCHNDQCPRRIFAERFPQLLLPYAQMTNRLREALRTLSFATSAEAAARLAPSLGLKSSPTTLLRCQKAAIIPPPPDVLRKVGLDDFAFRRGKAWGTIVINLETHQVVDLLPDRSVPTVVAWLLAHPSIELIRRDRGSDYITAANQGAPQARQVSDRWHILRNLSEYLFTFLARMRAYVRETSQALASPLPQLDPLIDACELVEPMWKNPRKKRRVPKTVYESNRETKAEQKRDQYQQILALREQQLTTDEIAARVGIPARTIRRWLKSGVETRPRRRRASPLDAYAGYIGRRLREGCQIGKHLFEELQSLGYAGSLTALYSYLDRWRGERLAPEAAVPSEQQVLPDGKIVSLPGPFDACHAKKAVWFFLRERRDLTAKEQEQLGFLRQVHPSLERAYSLVEAFTSMVRTQQAEPLESWLEEVKSCQIPELVRFGKGIERDKAAVQAALELPYSNGVVEGHVHRLKLIKRQGYGRASFPLLRQRVLYRAS